MDDIETLQGHIDNIAISADSQLYLLSESLKSDHSHSLIKSKLEKKLGSVSEEIENICSKNIQTIGSNLKQISENNQNLKKISDDLETSKSNTITHAEKLLQIKQKIFESKRKISNIKDLEEILNICLPALRIFDGLKHDLDRNYHINCIDNLLKLENEYLPHISGFSFSKRISLTIVDVKSKLKSSVLNDLRSFLTDARSAELQIGKDAMEKLNNFDESKSQIVDIDVEQMIDFSKLRTSHYVFSSLGCLQEFINSYRSQRKQQIILTINWQSTYDENKYKNNNNNDNNHSFDMLNDYFYRIIGFFIIEDQISQCIKGLIDLSYMKVLWDDSCTYIHNILLNHFSQSFEQDYAIQVKKNLSDLLALNKALNLPKDQLQQIIDGISRVFKTNSCIEYSKILLQCIKNEQFEVIQIDNSAQFDYEHFCPKPTEYPAVLDFSNYALTLYDLSSAFLRKIVDFIGDLYDNKGDLHEQLLESLRRFYSDFIPDSLSRSNIDQFEFRQILQISKDHFIVFRHFNNIILAIREMIKQNKFNIKPDFTISELFKPIFNILRDAISRFVEKRINEIFDLAHFGLNSQQDNEIIENTVELIECFINVFNFCGPDQLQFFVNRFFNDINNDFLFILKNLLSNPNINYGCIPVLKKIYDSICEFIENRNHKFIKTFVKRTNQIISICNLFLQWNWHEFDVKYREEEKNDYSLNVDHLKLCRMLLTKLDASTMPHEISKGTDGKNLIYEALNVVNKLI